MRIYWVGDRGFIEMEDERLPGLADITFEGGKLEVKISISVDVNLDDTKEVKIDY